MRHLSHLVTSRLLATGKFSNYAYCWKGEELLQTNREYDEVWHALQRTKRKIQGAISLDLWLFAQQLRASSQAWEAKE